MTSSAGVCVFARNVPLSFLKRELSLVEDPLLDACCVGDCTEGKGIVSTLVEADSNFGEEI